MEKTRNVVRSSISQASTISAEEQPMALTEKEFSMIKKKMDKIDHRMNELYKNWHAEYGNANTIEECEEIKNFYKPYLEKYESKYRVLYHLLQQPGLIPTHDSVSGITPSLSALDDPTSLKQKEWIHSEPGEDIPCQYSSIEGCLTPSTPRSEDMRLEPTLNVTPEGSLVDIPTVIKRETREQVREGDVLGTSSETTYMEIPKPVQKQYIKVLLQEYLNLYKEQRKLVEQRHWHPLDKSFAAVDRRNVNVSARNQLTSIGVH